jgi:hypothetical protein
VLNPTTGAVAGAKAAWLGAGVSGEVSKPQPDVQASAERAPARRRAVLSSHPATYLREGGLIDTTVSKHGGVLMREVEKCVRSA